MKKKIILAITGASGALYAKLLMSELEKLSPRQKRLRSSARPMRNRFGNMSWVKK